MLDTEIAEISRAIDHGFSAAELELAKTDLLSHAERAVETESTRESDQIVNMLSSAIGMDRPIASNDDEVGRQKNRRVEFHIKQDESLRKDDDEQDEGKE